MLSLAHQVATDLDRASGLDLLAHSWLEDEDAEDALDLKRTFGADRRFYVHQSFRRVISRRARALMTYFSATANRGASG